jgi:hypothetical protein
MVDDQIGVCLFYHARFHINKKLMLEIIDWPMRPEGRVKKMTTGHPVIVVVIPVVKVKNTEVHISIFGSAVVNEKEFAARTMTGRLT